MGNGVHVGAEALIDVAFWMSFVICQWAVGISCGAADFDSRGWSGAETQEYS